MTAQFFRRLPLGGSAGRPGKVVCQSSAFGEDAVMSDFTIADVLAWARTKPADERYDFTDCNGCAVARFGRETGREYLIGLSANQMIAISADLEQAVNPGARFLHCMDLTYGALVIRLEALCPVISDTWAKADAYLTDIELASA
jgi:hypothetical protein